MGLVERSTSVALVGHDSVAGVLMKRRLQASGKGRLHSRAATESRFGVSLPGSARRDDPDYRLAQLHRRDSVGGLPS